MIKNIGLLLSLREAAYSVII